MLDETKKQTFPFLRKKHIWQIFCIFQSFVEQFRRLILQIILDWNYNRFSVGANKALPTFELCRPNVWLAPHPPRFSASSVRRRLPCRNIHQTRLHQDWDSFEPHIVVILQYHYVVILFLKLQQNISIKICKHSGRQWFVIFLCNLSPLNLTQFGIKA